MKGLEKELAVYSANLSNLLKDEGKYVVIYGSEVVGIYSAYDDALKAGYDKAALEPFLVKKISGSETVAYFSRDIGQLCPTSPQ